MAWITGVKSDPWDIEWGDGTVGDILLLRGIDENMHYERALSLGKNVTIADTVLARPRWASRRADMTDH